MYLNRGIRYKNAGELPRRKDLPPRTYQLFEFKVWLDFHSAFAILIAPVLSAILNTRRYENAVQDDLWESFTQQARTDKVLLPATVKQIMDSWTLKMGIDL